MPTTFIAVCVALRGLLFVCCLSNGSGVEGQEIRGFLCSANPEGAAGNCPGFFFPEDCPAASHMIAVTLCLNNQSRGVLF